MTDEDIKKEKPMARLARLQLEMKAPKGRTNSFGKYNYRSCEDILEAAKPLLVKWGLCLAVEDEIVSIDGRFYVKATARIFDAETGAKLLVNSAFAREAEVKKGMDDSQLTGATSSYARKYALNGLFLLDDTKDADTDEYRNENASRFQKQGMTLKDYFATGVFTDEERKAWLDKYKAGVPLSEIESAVKAEYDRRSK